MITNCLVSGWVFVNYQVPRHLSHQPLVVVENYELQDGHYAPSSDAKGLSLGIAQWDPQDISVKVWRYTGNKWSRQSEELPLHRNLDLSILIVLTFIVSTDTSLIDKLKNTRTKITHQLNKVILQSGSYKIEVTLERPNEAKKFIEEHYNQLYKDRLTMLHDLIGVLL